MSDRSLQPGPIRDVLAKLDEHSKGDEPLTAGTLAGSAGLEYRTALRRLHALAEKGWARHELGATGTREFWITEQGRAMLDA